MHKSILALIFMIFSQITLAQTVDVSGTAICEKEVTFAEKICEHKAYKDAQANCKKQGGHHRFIDRVERFFCDTREIVTGINGGKIESTCTISCAMPYWE